MAISLQSFNFEQNPMKEIVRETQIYQKCNLIVALLLENTLIFANLKPSKYTLY